MKQLSGVMLGLVALLFIIQAWAAVGDITPVGVTGKNFRNLSTHVAILDKRFSTFSANHATPGGGTTDISGLVEKAHFLTYSGNRQTEISNLYAGKADVVHSQAIATITGLQTALDNKAAATDLSNHTGLTTTAHGGVVAHTAFGTYSTHRYDESAAVFGQVAANTTAISGKLNSATFTGYTSIRRITNAAFSGYTGAYLRRTGGTITAPTLTGSQATPAISINQSWNTTGTPTALSLNITDTASNAASILMDLQQSGNSRAKFYKTGKAEFSRTSDNSARIIIDPNSNSGLVSCTTMSASVHSSVNGGAVNNAVFQYNINTGMWFPSTSSIALALAGTEYARLTTTGLGIGTTSPAAKLDILPSAFDSTTALRVKDSSTGAVLTVDGTGALQAGGATNYVKLDSDYGVTLGGTATVWDDLRLEPTGRGGSTEPVMTALGFDSLLYAYLYPNSTAKYLYANVQMSHQWAGTDVYPHAHIITANSTNTGDIVFTLRCSWASIDGTHATGADYTMTCASAGNGTAYKHRMCGNASAMSMTGLGISATGVCRITRDTTDGYPDDVSLTYLDIHYEKNKLGSRTGTAY